MYSVAQIAAHVAELKHIPDNSVSQRIFSREAAYLNKLVNRSREAGRPYNEQSFVTTRLSRPLSTPKKADAGMDDSRDQNPYASPQTTESNRRKILSGTALLVNEFLIRLTGLACIAGAILSVLVPESMNWCAEPIVVFMYRYLRNEIPGSLLMLLPYFTFAALLVAAAIGLMQLQKFGRIAATIVCGLGISSFQLGAIPCMLILTLLWSPLSNQSFSKH